MNFLIQKRNSVSVCVLLLFIILFAGATFVDAQKIVGAGKYRFVLGNGASFAAASRMAVANNMYLAYWTGCKFISYHPRDLCKGGHTNHKNCSRWIPTSRPNNPGTPGRNSPPGGGGTPSGGGTNTVVDVCVNIRNTQLTMPAGYRDVGGRICQSDGSFQAYCSANPAIVGPGDSVNFIANPFNAEEGDVTYAWTSTETGTIVKSETVEDRSIYQTSFATIGIHRVSIRATDSKGNTASHTCGVTVSNNPEEARRQAAANPDADPPEVSLTGGGITNTTCPVTWTSKNTTDCLLVDSLGGEKEVTKNGSDDVQPGTYRLRCLAEAEVGRIAETDPVICRENIDIREI